MADRKSSRFPMRGGYRGSAPAVPPKPPKGPGASYNPPASSRSSNSEGKEESPGTSDDK
jgi:hypothetical protein